MELTGLPTVSAPLPWQGEIWARFNQQLQDGQLPHALLLTGPEHSGKAALALALARLLLCQAPSGGLNCGHCHACALSAGGSHGDFRWLQPQEKSRNIKIDQVRELVGFTNKTAGFGKCKVAVLAPADSMNSNAANALLKSLEEPTADTYLVLVCHRLHAVPATIRSRCQILKLPAPQREDALAWLDKMTGQRQVSERLLDLTGGMPLLAEAVYREVDGEDLIKVRIALQGLLAGEATSAEVVALVADAPAEELLTQLATALQDLLRGYTSAQLTSPTGRGAFALLDELTGLQRAVQGGSNPNKQLMAEALLGKVQRLLGAAATGGNIRP